MSLHRHHVTTVTGLGQLTLPGRVIDRVRYRIDIFQVVTDDVPGVAELEIDLTTAGATDLSGLRDTAMTLQLSDGVGRLDVYHNGFRFVALSDVDGVGL